MLKSLLLLTTFAAVAAEECDGSDASQLLQRSAVGRAQTSSWDTFERAVKGSSDSQRSMPMFMAKMGLDAALAMLKQQVDSVDDMAAMTGSQLSGLLGHAPADQAEAVLHQAHDPLEGLFEVMSRELRKGGMQTEMVLGMAGLQAATKAYETSVHQASAVLKGMRETCTSLFGDDLPEVLSQCSDEIEGFKEVYPEIMEEFLGSLSDNLLERVEDKDALQDYIDQKVPEVMKTVDGMCTKVRA